MRFLFLRFVFWRVLFFSAGRFVGALFLSVHGAGRARVAQLFIFYFFALCVLRFAFRVSFAFFICSRGGRAVRSFAFFTAQGLRGQGA